MAAGNRLSGIFVSRRQCIEMPITSFIRNQIWHGLPKPAEVTWSLRGVAALAWGGALILIGALLAWRGSRAGAAFAGPRLIGFAAAGLGLAALVLLPKVGPVFYVGVMRGFALLGFVVSNLLMAVFFYLFVTPMALAMRLAGRDPIDERRRVRPVWHIHTGKTERKRYYRMF